MVARAVQGVAGAVVSAISLSLIMNLFTEPAERAKAMGVYGFVCAGGGSIGVLLGGLLTGSLSWHWIFLVNLPIGIAVAALCLVLLPKTPPVAGGSRLDVAGAATVTLALMLAVYAIVNGNEAGWLSVQTLALLGGAVLLLGAFVAIESRVAAPLVPSSLFRLRNLSTASIVGVLWAAGMFAWFFISALYLQLVLGYTPMQVGLAFLPSNLIMAAFSLGLSAQLVMRFGLKKPLAGGLLVAALGLALFARAPVDGNVWIDVLPSMLLLGVGAGVAFNPLLLAAMSEVKPQDSGLASGIVNTAFMMGGALGLAVLASLAAARTGQLTAEGMDAKGRADLGLPPRVPDRRGVRRGRGGAGGSTVHDRARGRRTGASGDCLIGACWGLRVGQLSHSSCSDWISPPMPSRVISPPSRLLGPKATERSLNIACS